MKQAQPLSSRIRWLGPLVVIVVVLAAMVLHSLTRPSAAIAEGPAALAIPPINAVYLPDASRPVLPPAQARAVGIRIVSSSAELINSATTADAIIIDRGALGQVDQQLLAGQLGQERLIVGLNVPFSELERLPAYHQPRTPHNYREDWGERPFYSWLWQREQGGRRYSVSGSDVIPSAEDFLGRLEDQIRAIREAQVQPTPDPRTTPPVRPTRPTP